MRVFCSDLDTQEPNIGAEITTEPRINDRIRTPQIRLINYTGEQVGVVDIEAALAMADEIGLDLVEIAPEANPPVCKIMDFGKYKYQEAQKAREARQNQTHIVVKEVRIDTKDRKSRLRDKALSSREVPQRWRQGEDHDEVPWP